MPRLVRFTMDNTAFIKSPDLAALVATNSEALKVADQWLDTNS